MTISTAKFVTMASPAALPRPVVPSGSGGGLVPVAPLAGLLASGRSLGQALKDLTGLDPKPRAILPPGPSLPFNQDLASPPPENVLLVGSKLWSPNRLAYLTMLPDGTLALFDARGESATNPARVIWSSNEGSLILNGDVPTFNPHSRPAAVMQNDGNLVIADFGTESGATSAGKAGYPPWSTANPSIHRAPSETKGYDLPQPGAYLTVQDDGNLVVYQADGRKALWASGTQGFAEQKDQSGAAVANVVQIIGAIVLFVVTVFLPALGITVGAVFSSLLSEAVHTLPGLIRGEPVDQVFFQNLQDIATKVTGYVANDLKVPQALSDLQTQMSPMIGAVSGNLQDWADRHSIDFSRLGDLPESIRKQVATTLDVQSIASDLGVRPDVVQLMIDGATRTTNAAGNVFDDAGNIVSPTLLHLASISHAQAVSAPSFASQVIAKSRGAAPALAQANLSAKLATRAAYVAYYLNLRRP